MDINNFGFDSSRLRAYSGYYFDKNTLYESASGGAANAIAEAILSVGGCVFGVTYTKDFKGAEYCLVENKKDLKRLKGSKYIDSSKTITYKGESKSVFYAVLSELALERKVLFIGLGCTVAGLYSFLNNKKADITNLFTVEILCHGPTYSSVADQFISGIEKKYHSTVKDFSVRYKKKGWVPSYLRAVFENGKIFEKPFSETDYGYAFGRFSKKSCYSCIFKGDNHKGDVTVGDYWGIKEGDENYNKGGVSIIIIQSNKGNELLNIIDASSFKVSPTDVDFVLKHNMRYVTPNQMKPGWEEFDQNLKNRGLHYAVLKDLGFVRYYGLKIKTTIRKMIPGFAKRIIKKILHR